MHERRNFHLGVVDDCGIEPFALDATRGLGSGSVSTSSTAATSVRGWGLLNRLHWYRINHTGENRKECHRRTNFSDGDDEKHGDRAAADAGHRHRCGDDGERTDFNDRDKNDERDSTNGAMLKAIATSDTAAAMAISPMSAIAASTTRS